MFQKQLNQLVAAATGEDLHEISHRGFSLVDPLDSNFDPEPDDRPPQMIDWDELDLQRHVALTSRPRPCLPVP